MLTRNGSDSSRPEARCRQSAATSSVCVRKTEDLQEGPSARSTQKGFSSQPRLLSFLQNQRKSDPCLRVLGPTGGSVTSSVKTAFSRDDGSNQWRPFRAHASLWVGFNAQALSPTNKMPKKQSRRGGADEKLTRKWSRASSGSLGEVAGGSERSEINKKQGYDSFFS